MDKYFDYFFCMKRYENIWQQETKTVQTVLSWYRDINLCPRLSDTTLLDCLFVQILCQKSYKHIYSSYSRVTGRSAINNSNTYHIHGAHLIKIIFSRVTLSALGAQNKTALRHLQWINPQAPLLSALKREAFRQALMTKIKTLSSNNTIYKRKHSSGLLLTSLSIVRVWLITRSPDFTTCGSELLLSILTRLCTFWLAPGQDANLNIFISHQPKCLRLLFFPPVLPYSPQLPLVSVLPVLALLGKSQANTLPPSLASALTFSLGCCCWVHTTLVPVMPRGAGVNAECGFRNPAGFCHSWSRWERFC